MKDFVTFLLFLFPPVLTLEDLEAGRRGGEEKQGMKRLLSHESSGVGGKRWVGKKLLDPYLE